MIYTMAADMVLRNTVQHCSFWDPLFVITDRLPLKRKRESLVKGFKNCLAAVARDRNYEVAHHSAAAHGCLQAADYMNWAVFRKWERNDYRSYDLVRSLIAEEVRLDSQHLRKK